MQRLAEEESTSKGTEPDMLPTATMAMCEAVLTGSHSSQR